MTLFMRIGAFQVGKWQYSFQSSMEMQLIQHDNARHHTSLRTQEEISKFGWTVLPHPSYSPDLAPSDFHLLGPLKDALRGARFEEDESVSFAVRTWLRKQERSWYRKGTHAVASRWRKAVDLDVHYVEK
jgi:histone-lysine N-methyltransferase SETMAR